MKIFATIGLVSLSVAGFAQADSWSTAGGSGSPLEIFYGNSVSDPQYGALDLTSSYLRLNYGPTSGWGTSIDTMPSLWSGGNYYQGYAVTESSKVVGSDLQLTLVGVLDIGNSKNTLTTHETITLAPPADNAISATVSATTVSTGSWTLDANRPGEAFKPVFLSSMHDSPTSWDSSTPFAGGQTFSFPTGGWIVSPTQNVNASTFGLNGGTSDWKTNAPTTTILFSSPVQVAGYLTTDTNPNDDNVGYWAASSSVMSSWHYTATASKASPTPELPTAFTLLSGIIGAGMLRFRRNG